MVQPVENNANVCKHVQRKFYIGHQRERERESILMYRYLLVVLEITFWEEMEWQIERTWTLNKNEQLSGT